MLASIAIAIVLFWAFTEDGSVFGESDQAAKRSVLAIREAPTPTISRCDRCNLPRRPGAMCPACVRRQCHSGMIKDHFEASEALERALDELDKFKMHIDRSTVAIAKAKRDLRSGGKEY